MTFGLESAIGKSVLNVAQYGLGILATLHILTPMWQKPAHVQNDDVFDFIIIGSGAGAVVANRLTENEDTEVLLIEAGDDPSVEALLAGLFTLTQNSYQDWSFKSEKDAAAVSQDGGDFNLAAGKVMGGSTSIGHLVYLRGDPVDFNSWAEIVNDESWNYESVLPYFKKSEMLLDEEILRSTYGDFHGKNGEMGITKEPNKRAEPYLNSFKELNKPVVLDLNSNVTIGYTQGLLFNNKLRQSTAVSYLSIISERKNLNVLRKSVAIEILFDEDNKATGVLVKLANGVKVRVKARKEVIVSAGVYNTPKLLMLSGIGPSEDLERLNIPVRSDLPVGQTLYDHSAVILVHKMERSIELPEIPNPMELGLPLIIGNVKVNPEKSYPQYQTTNLIVPHDSPFSLIICAQLFGYRNDICDHIQNDGKGRNLFVSFLGNLVPVSTGYVKLRSLDSNDDPIISTGFLSNEIDVENMARYIEDFVEIKNSTYFIEVNAELEDMNLENCSAITKYSTDYWKCYTRNMLCSLYHPTSTCPMGTVVDNELFVKGVQNLRIVDSSIFPYITKANPQAATIMVAEKASDMIKARHNL